ncbi:antitoxin YezG family protein [Paenibacillus polymyxa]|uniref:antitoxin YezG family protein n=1 Tax=Paenibacillus polymyxa TaxID=1406 RepID=UPI002ED02A33|nr:antitoxin YezG family protein [Paenibacillus polymyxa]
MEKQLDQLYPQIAEHILGMIPEDNWQEIYLHAEILDDSSNVYFYFNTSKNDDFQYSHDIPGEYGVSEKIYDDLLLELQVKFEELRKIFIVHDQEAWTNLTFILKYPGKLKIHYGYEDIIASKVTPTQRQMIFEYQCLGLLPRSEKDKQFVMDYVKSQEK